MIRMNDPQEDSLRFVHTLWPFARMFNHASRNPCGDGMWTLWFTVSKGDWKHKKKCGCENREVGKPQILEYAVVAMQASMVHGLM